MPAFSFYFEYKLTKFDRLPQMTHFHHDIRNMDSTLHLRLHHLLHLNSQRAFHRDSSQCKPQHKVRRKYIAHNDPQYGSGRYPPSGSRAITPLNFRRMAAATMVGANRFVRVRNHLPVCRAAIVVWRRVAVVYPYRRGAHEYIAIAVWRVFVSFEISGDWRQRRLTESWRQISNAGDHRGSKTSIVLDEVVLTFASVSA